MSYHKSCTIALEMFNGLHDYRNPKEVDRPDAIQLGSGYHSWQLGDKSSDTYRSACLNPQSHGSTYFRQGTNLTCDRKHKSPALH
jgi:hypothetical protein